MSRLLDNTNKTRDSLEARNLYTPNDPYDANASNAVDSINAISSIINPFGSFDLSNTIAGRLVGNNTPLAQIGLQMLSLQFGRTAASNASANYLPSIKFENLFDGDPDTKFISVKKDFQITRRELQSDIGKILEEISGSYPLKGNPFTKTSTNIDYIRNSGKGQLQVLVKNLNSNKYKPSSLQVQSTLKSEGFDYGDMSSITDKTYFLDWDNEFNPFNQYKQSPYVNVNSLNNNLNLEVKTYRNIANPHGNLEYGSSQEFVDALGNTNLYNNNNGSGDYKFERDAEYNHGLNDSLYQNLIWGRDGVTTNYRDVTKGFDDPLKDTVQPSQNGETVPKTSRFNFSNNEDSFNMEAGGLLSYTRELLNSKGKYSMFDLTKKKFLDTDDQVHFNGSPLTKRLNGDTDRNRQHNITDPYDNYVKAIRFNGNKMYGGNENSVIYKSVIPQVTPEIGGTINKNLMFSIENLAMVVNGNNFGESTYGIVEDDFGTELPLNEVGPNNGRLMWFPPYDIQLSENVVVNRTSTNFIGRGEPIYTYNNTERMANLSFKLIIDYPPQVKGLDHVQASRFFAFGGEGGVSVSNISEKEKRKKELEEQRDNILPKTELAVPDFQEYKGNFYFWNDQPNNENKYKTVDYHLIENPYEIPDSNDSLNLNLNVGWKDKIDKAIDDLLVNTEILPFIEINIIGRASLLYNNDGRVEYNKNLGQRRADGIAAYIYDEYKDKTGRSLIDDGLTINATSRGDLDATDATNEASEISDKETKLARSVSIEFKYNETTKLKDVPLSEKELKNKAKLDADIIAIDKEISNQKRGTNSSGMDFNPYIITDGVLKGFESTERGIYKPAFHSQTPEDFHRRLTFLHQCTRQGEAIRKKRGTDNSFSANNAVFGRQPVQVLRIGDFFNTKIIIENMQIDYSEAPWDMNPEGMGMQFMMADVKLTIKLLGGQSLKGPINALQNAVSYNYYANSTFYNDGVYANATKMEDLQEAENNRATEIKNKELAEKREKEKAATKNNKTTKIPNNN